jgi:Family of unknown function (DUF5715)
MSSQSTHPRRLASVTRSTTRRFHHPLHLAMLLATAAALPLGAQTLHGTHESMLRQNVVAQEHDYTYLRTTQDVMQAVAGGELVGVHPNPDLELATDEVSFPYARPHVRIFLEQLAHAYHEACGEPLVVTSLTRPISRQPWNASPISVHPTGMAVDLRRSERHACRQWIESTLLALNAEGMVEAIRERWPAHYHVAVFPDPLLLPGPIGDPEGVVRLAALHHETFGTLQEVDDDSSARTTGVRVVRSSRTGRIRIVQTGRSSIARSSGRIAAHRARRRAGAHRSASSHPVAAVSRHRGSRSHAAAVHTATAR